VIAGCRAVAPWLRGCRQAPAAWGGGRAKRASCGARWPHAQGAGWRPAQQRPAQQRPAQQRPALPACPAGAQHPSGGGTVTLEPGGQLELSGAPLADLHEMRAELQAHLDLVG
jgi:hypothetical protein